MKLYNTLTREIQEIKPNDATNIKIYSCGPTVYEKSHIGHWYTYIRDDLLIRLLKYNYSDVTWVLNITDVGHLVSDGDEGEDKLIKSATLQKKTAWQIAEFYTEDFLNGLKKLNIQMPSYLPKATDHINEQINLIKKLENKGFTYQIDDGIYFDSSKFKSYADFAQLDVDEMQSGKRVIYNAQKKNISDFALWKFSPKGIKRDMEWDSPWGIGFPGWHIECSAMSMKYLGDNFDIHTGGIDHIPVHHTNEIAQSMSITGKIPANYWFHSNHVTINNEKISKSLGNGITLDELENEKYKLESFRLHVLESHYRTQSKFKKENLLAAQNRLTSWRKIAALIWQVDNEAILDFEDYKAKILEALNNDLNTPLVLSILDQSFDDIYNNINETSKVSLVNYLSFIDNLLGLSLASIKDINNNFKDLINKREGYKLNRQWEESDKIRQELLDNNIALIDSLNNKTYWYYL